MSGRIDKAYARHELACKTIGLIAHDRHAAIDDAWSAACPAMVRNYKADMGLFVAQSIFDHDSVERWQRAAWDTSFGHYLHG